MGIKGIYEEIGPGDRISLAKLSIEKFEQIGRPLRLAIDISIWQFQIQSGKGGTNPALRTLYYRLLRLLSLCIQPLFVFDGPHKPPVKRNKRTGLNISSLPDLLTTQMLKYFGFPFHFAPGEAEAECALLQRYGIVDAVLSEDVDTLMFGCGLTLRNWSSEPLKSNHSPTHVSVYDAKATKEGRSGLDREGMVLVALMSGGDYNTEGIPGCGIKVACQAARAGYGKSLCQLSQNDTAGWEAWRRDLAHQLQTNELKYFRNRHKTLKIPDDFPNQEVLKYYTHPVVSKDSKLATLKEEIIWDGEVDIPGLRAWGGQAFGWTGKIGAKKFIRNLAPALLVSKLRAQVDRRASGHDSLLLTAANEMELVRAICGKRNHTSTDGLSELRLIYHPADIVGLDLEAELDDTGEYSRDPLAPRDEDDNFDPYQSGDEASLRSRSASPAKKGLVAYDPTQPEKLWVLETIVKVGVPLKAEDYDEGLRNPLKGYRTKAGAKKAMKGGMPKGALDRYLAVIKPNIELRNGAASQSPQKLPLEENNLRPIRLPSSLDLLPATQPKIPAGHVRPRREHFKTLERAKDKLESSNTAQRSPRHSNRSKIVSKGASKNTITNPWVLSSSPPALCGFSVSKPRANENSITKITSPLPKTFMKTITPITLSPSDSEVRNKQPSGISDHSNSVAKRTTRSSATFDKGILIGDGPELQVKRRTDILVTSEAQSHSSFVDLPSMNNVVSQSNQSPEIPSKGPKAFGQEEMRDVVDIVSSPRQHEKTAGNQTKRQHSPKNGEAKRLIMLRESLEGSWKEVTEQQNRAVVERCKDGEKLFGRGRQRIWRQSQIEELDMTAGD